MTNINAELRAALKARETNSLLGDLAAGRKLLSDTNYARWERMPLRMSIPRLACGNALIRAELRCREAA